MTQEIAETSRPRIRAAIAAATDFLARWRGKRGAGTLAGVSDREVGKIARDLGLTPEELLEYDESTLDRTEKQKRLLDALHIDPEAIPQEAVGDMYRSCGNCGHKVRCEYHLTLGDAAQTFEEFCPNAAELKKLAPGAGRQETPFRAGMPRG